MQKVQKKQKRKKQYLKLSSKYWTSTKTPLLKFYN
jgi:hypothetical protein